MIGKVWHYLRRYVYRRSHRMLPALEGGVAAGGQDVLVAELLSGKRGGVFVDIGANDGRTISNTWHLEKELDWSGVAVEPMPETFERLRAQRSCVCVRACVAPRSGRQKFLQIEGKPNMLSTLASQAQGLAARRIRRNLERHGASVREIEVECVTYEALLAAHGLGAVDFLSLDTEGGELEILRSIDFRRNPVKVISVENNYFTTAIRRHLEGEGFFYLGTFGVDELYVHGGARLSEALRQAAGRDWR